MNRCAGTAIGVVAALSGNALAQDEMGVTAAEASDRGPGNTEAGLFLGGFISNHFHQFYDPEVMPNREEIDRVSPLFGVRFAAFPSRIVGVEIEGSLIMASTKESG